MADTVDDFARAASRLLYVCRLYGPTYVGKRGLQLIKCAECSRLVVATPAILTEKRRWARALGRDLDVVCDDCGVTAMETSPGGTVVRMPTEADYAEARLVDEGLA